MAYSSQRGPQPSSNSNNRRGIISQEKDGPRACSAEGGLMEVEMRSPSAPPGRNIFSLSWCSKVSPALFQPPEKRNTAPAAALEPPLWGVIYKPRRACCTLRMTWSGLQTWKQLSHQERAGRGQARTYCEQKNQWQQKCGIRKRSDFYSSWLGKYLRKRAIPATPKAEAGSSQVQSLNLSNRVSVRPACLI